MLADVNTLRTACRANIGDVTFQVRSGNEWNEERYAGPQQGRQHFELHPKSKIFLSPRPPPLMLAGGVQ